MTFTVARKANENQSPHFVFVIENEFPLYTLVLLTEPLRIANQNAGRLLFTWQVASESSAAHRAGSGSWIAVDSNLDAIERADVVILLGGNLPFQQITRKMVAHLQRFARRGATIGATNTGSIVLASAGLLKDRRVTIHWESIPALVEHFPEVEVVECLFVHDRDRITCAGGMAALDMILSLIDHYQGSSMGNEVARALVHSRREGTDRQRPMDIAEAERSLATRMIRVMESNVETPLDAGALADKLGCSRRTMERVARIVLGDSPMRIYLKIRLQVARNLLFYDQTSISEIALICGFASISEFSRTFRTYYRKSPRTFRAEFRSKQIQSIRPDLVRLQSAGRQP